jgi:hypothetical protein
MEDYERILHESAPKKASKKQSSLKVKNNTIISNENPANFTDMSQLYLDDSKLEDEASPNPTRNNVRERFQNSQANRSLEFHDNKMQHMDTVFKPKQYLCKSPSPESHHNGMFSNVSMRYSVNGNPYTIILPFSQNTNLGHFGNQNNYDPRSISHHNNHDFNGSKSKN